MLGEQNEELYKSTNNAEISYAFRKAGAYKWHDEKIVLIIVEGPSDADSLELYFSKFFDSNTVHMKIMYGDITSKRGINQFEYQG